MSENPTMEAARRRHAMDSEAAELVERLTRMVNIMSTDRADVFATTLANEHPTLIGQVARAVGIAVMRRATRNPRWKPDDTWEATCFGNGASPKPAHAEHDARLQCDTVIGAALMAHQGLI